MPVPSLPQLQRALAVAEKIQALETELATILEDLDQTGAPGRLEIKAPGRPKAKAKPGRKIGRTLSAEARARMAESARKRWAKARKAQS
jgi:hypothetical protein